MGCFFNNMGAEELSFMANLIALELSCGKDADEINVLGNLITTIGTIMLTIASQKENLENLSKKNCSKKTMD